MAVNPAWDTDQAACLLDELYLEMLHLLEQKLCHRKDWESQIVRADMLLTRSRIQHGKTNVKLHQSKPLRALMRLLLYPNDSSMMGTILKLVKIPVNESMGVFSPIEEIFGTLVPWSMRVAGKKFDRCIGELVKQANLERELQTVMAAIERLEWAMQSNHQVV